MVDGSGHRHLLPDDISMHRIRAAKDPELYPKIRLRCIWTILPGVLGDRVVV